MADAPEQDSPTPTAQGATSPLPSVEHATATSGRREAFRDLRRRLTDADLAGTGVQKMLLDELERAETECDGLSGYVDRFHEADKRSAILEEKLRGDRAIDVAFGVGVGLGGTIIGFAPTLWSQPPMGTLALLIGGFLVAGGTAVRIVKK